MILIIAEKPSLGRNIAGSIGNMTSKNGYMEGNGYIVTWAFGHLFSLADIEEYSDTPVEDRRWKMDNLPCFPKEFRFELKKGSDKKVDGGVVRQFELIKTLCNRADVDTVVNAGDADREGEIIVRLCVRHAMSESKPFKRLWLPDQTPETIRKALSEMKDESEYESLANEGLARTYIDWLYGVNLTRYATLKTGTLLRVGRVIIPIVKAIYDRDMAIRNFVPGKYYAIISRAETGGEIVELVSKTRFDSDKYDEALAFCARYNSEKAIVTAVKKKKDKLAPGKLYSLSKLQNVLGKKYKMSMAESLEIVQKLYEKGYLTYPRTNSEYLATAEKDKIKTIIANCKKLGYPVEFKDKKTIFDDSKIESHSALTPTYKIPDKTTLSDKEMQVYSAVFRRFIAVFCAEECVVEKSEITIALGDLEEFLLKGTVIVEAGWTKYDDNSQKDKLLPKLNKGDIVNTDFQAVEKETSPPKHYTIETLNNYLKNPFRDQKNEAKAKAADDKTDDSAETDDTEDYKAIFEGLELGTEATRTGIIDNARKSEYIQLKKDVYTILPKGEFLIESLSRMKISMDKYKTSELGQALKKVYRGVITVRDSVALAEREISEVFEKKNVSFETDEDTGCFGDVVGKCPLCGNEIVRGRFSYGCRGYKEGCQFKVNLYICERAISISNIKRLLETGSTATIVGFRSKRTGKTFDAMLKMEGDKAVFAFDSSKEAPRKNAGFSSAYMEAPPEMAPLPDQPPPI